MIFVMETIHLSWSEGLPPGFWDVHNIHQLKEGYGNLRQRKPSMSLKTWCTSKVLAFKIKPFRSRHVLKIIELKTNLQTSWNAARPTLGQLISREWLRSYLARSFLAIPQSPDKVTHLELENRVMPTPVTIAVTVMTMPKMMTMTMTMTMTMNTREAVLQFVGTTLSGTKWPCSVPRDPQQVDREDGCRSRANWIHSQGCGCNERS